MPALQRSVSIRGPRFYIDGEQIMFVNYLDASTREGPRAANAQDSVEHSKAWADFQRDQPETPLLPVLVAVDPPEGRPAPEEGVYARRRKEAAAREQTAGA